MQSICTTLWATYLETCAHLGLPFTIKEHTTLNEKLEIQGSATLNTGEMPRLAILCIGNKGHRAVTGTDNFPLTVPVDHQADHAALYGQIPFVLRDTNNDLTPDQRAKYALRKTVNINGRNYYAYYGKRIDMADVVPKLQKTVVEDGQSTTTDYIPTTANLNPEWPDIPNTGAVSTSGSYLSASAVVSVNFGEFDVTELYNVAKIMYNDQNYAVISEFAFCTAVDRTVSVPTPSGNTNFKEAIACQVATFVGGHYELVYYSKGFDFKVELGANEPLLGAEEIVTATFIQ